MTDRLDPTGESLAGAIRAVREGEPLVQHLCNEVTKNDLANCTLHWGALPVMADAPGEAPEMAELADAVLLNTGRMTDSNVEALHAAGLAANDLDIPVVLDPVGVGATPTRSAVAESLLQDVDVTAIRGNAGEISYLAGEEGEVKGVEAVGEYERIAETAQVLAEETDSIVVATGAADVVADADDSVRVRTGHEMLSRVVGTGDMLGSTIAAFASVDDDPFAASVHGTAAFGIAGERATTLEYEGPASYKVNLLDSVANLSPDAAASVALGDRITPL